jgi:hypothetical protein
MKKGIVIIIAIVPYLAVCMLASIGHLALCLWFWKRPKRGFWRDLIYIFKRLIKGFENLKIKNLEVS